MGRKTNFWDFGPGAICDACGHPAYDLHRAGSDCVRCDEGVYMHRRYWHFVACPSCGHVAGHSTCTLCRGSGVMGIPREDIDLGELRSEWLSLNAPRGGHPPSAAARLRAHWATLE